MNNATKRAILRWVHLVATIPVLGYVYGPPAEVVQYVDGPRYIFVPVLLLTGYWMYAGLWFALLGVAAWLAAIHFLDFGPALLSQIVLLVARKIWLAIRARKSK
jgi:thiosulfate reductase cytochrome b subunit